MQIAETRKASDLSEAMNEQRRVRACRNGHKIDTVEMPRSELQSLRTMAHMKGTAA